MQRAPPVDGGVVFAVIVVAVAAVRVVFMAVQDYVDADATAGLCRCCSVVAVVISIVDYE